MFISRSVYSLDDLRFQNKSFQAFFDSVDPEKPFVLRFPVFTPTAFRRLEGEKRRVDQGK